jgi:hypothetical protein
MIIVLCEDWRGVLGRHYCSQYTCATQRVSPDATKRGGERKGRGEGLAALWMFSKGGRKAAEKALIWSLRGEMLTEKDLSDVLPRLRKRTSQMQKKGC